MARFMAHCRARSDGSSSDHLANLLSNSYQNFASFSTWPIQSSVSESEPRIDALRVAWTSWQLSTNFRRSTPRAIMTAPAATSHCCPLSPPAAAHQMFRCKRILLQLVQTERRFLCFSIAAITSPEKGRCVFSCSQSPSNRSTVSFAVEITRCDGSRALSAIVSSSR